MYRKTAVIATLLMLCGVMFAKAEDSTDSSKQSPPKQVTAYHLEFALNELDDGKKVNTRHYSMNLTDDNTMEDLKIGTRVPVETESGKFEYLDVGTNITARLVQYKLPMSLDVRANVSNFAIPGEVGHGGRPLLRQMVISGSTIAVIDKPIIIGSVDDPDSKREFQLEVTLTRLK